MMVTMKGSSFVSGFGPHSLPYPAYLCHYPTLPRTTGHHSMNTCFSAMHRRIERVRGRVHPPSIHLPVRIGHPIVAGITELFLCGVWIIGHIHQVKAYRCLILVPTFITDARKKTKRLFRFFCLTHLAQFFVHVCVTPLPYRPFWPVPLSTRQYLRQGQDERAHTHAFRCCQPYH